MNDHDDSDSDDDSLPPGQTAFQNYQASAKQRSQNPGTSASQRPQNPGPSASQRSRNPGPSASSRSENPGPSVSQRSQNPGPSASLRSQNVGASASQRSQNNRASANQSSQNHGPSTSQSSQNHGASTSQSSQNHGASTSQSSQNHAGSKSQVSREAQLANITQGLYFIMERVEELSKEGPGQNKTKEEKKNKPQLKEQHKCKLCNKALMNKTNLFRHYSRVHPEFDPAMFGYTVNNSILNIEDASFQEFKCDLCDYTGDRNAVDIHTVVVHTKCRVCGYKASCADDLVNHSRKHIDTDNNVNASAGTSVSVVNPSRVIENVKDKMHKCDDCSCYFDDKSKFDEHMKVQHGFEVLCKICNKNFRFKDIERHVKDTHPDVYNKKDETVKRKGSVIVEHIVRSKSGRMEIVFKCTKCTGKFYDRREAWRHAKIHKKELRTNAVANNMDAMETANLEELPADNYIIYICEACNIATASYDVVVEHSQKHLTNPNAVFLPDKCDVCNLNFEPICFIKHIDLHYKNKETNKESFRYLKYKYQLLLTNDWFEFFNMPDELVKKIVAQSIYAETRSVKMRAISKLGPTQHNINLYQCSRCNNFVEPSAVNNHTINFDTCVKIKNSFTCSVCKRRFNTQIARDNHETAHNGNESFQIVIFNNKTDKEVNKLLNDLTTEPVNLQRLTETVEKVIYKCLCGLCFVYKESAINHTKVCPGNEPKLSCQICNHLFNLHELLTHCSEHHVNENTSLIIEDIIPEAILVESDDESKNEDCMDEIIVLSSDDEDEQNKNTNKNDKAKYAVNTAGLNDVLERDKENKPQNSQIMSTTQANVSIAEQTNIQAKDSLVTSVTTTSNDDVSMDEDDENERSSEQMNEQHSDHSNHDMTDDDDSQDTVTYSESVKNDTNLNTLDVVARRNNEIKCVEINSLINPFHVRSTLYSSIRGEVNKKIATEIEDMRLKIAGANDVKVIKDEIPWYLDENDVSEIYWRPSLRQIEMSNVTSTDNQIIVVEDLLTDDEDVEMAAVSEQTDEIQENSNDVNSNGTIVPFRNHTKNNNAKEEIRDIDNNVVSNVNANLHNGPLSHANVVSDRLNINRNFRYHYDTTIDIFRSIERNDVSVTVNNRKFNDSVVLAEKHSVINTDNIKIEDETKIKPKIKTRIEHDMNGCDDLEIVRREPIYSGAVPIENVINDVEMENRLVVNNLEIQLSGHNVVMKPTCNIS